jgi:hypothetical protein
MYTDEEIKNLIEDLEGIGHDQESALERIRGICSSLRKEIACIKHPVQRFGLVVNWLNENKIHHTYCTVKTEFPNQTVIESYPVIQGFIIHIGRYSIWPATKGDFIRDSEREDSFVEMFEFGNQVDVIPFKVEKVKFYWEKARFLNAFGINLEDIKRKEFKRRKEEKG